MVIRSDYQNHSVLYCGYNYQKGKTHLQNDLTVIICDSDGNSV